MGKKKKPKPLAPYHGPYTEGPFDAVKSEKARWPWRVVAHGKLVAVIQSGRNRADAERVAACLNALQDIPTQTIRDGAVVKMWLSLRHLADLAEGVPLPVPPEQMAAFQAQVLAEAREALAAVGQGQEPPAEAEPKGGE